MKQIAIALILLVLVSVALSVRSRKKLRNKVKQDISYDENGNPYYTNDTSGYNAGSSDATSGSQDDSSSGYTTGENTALDNSTGSNRTPPPQQALPPYSKPLPTTIVELPPPPSADIALDSKIYFDYPLELPPTNTFVGVQFFDRSFEIFKPNKLCIINLNLPQIGMASKGMLRLALTIDDEILNDYTFASDSVPTPVAPFNMFAYKTGLMPGVHRVQLKVAVTGSELYIPAYEPGIFKEFNASPIFSNMLVYCLP